MQQTYAEQLRQVRDSLTDENWIKKSYFSNKNNTLCMCVHGAAQTIVNPEVKKALESNNSLDAPAITVGDRAAEAANVGVVASRRAAAARAASAGLRSAISNKSLLDLWSNRPDWVKRNNIFQYKNYGSVNLHYLMGIFGITTSFNDNLNTTLDMVKAKLSEAANWAEANEEFLQNN